MSHKYIVFSILLLILRFALAGLEVDTGFFLKYKNIPKSSIYSLEELIDSRYNSSGYFEELWINFTSSKCERINSMHINLSEKDRELLKGFKKIKIKIKIFKTCINSDTFKKIVRQVRPTELYLLGLKNIFTWIEGSPKLCYGLTSEDIRNIKLNSNIEIFVLNNNPDIKNMDGLFGDWNKKLIEVNISNNNLKSIPTGLENASVLEKLNISNNYNIFKNWNILDEEVKEYKKFKSVTILYMRYIGLGNISEEKLFRLFNLFPNVRDLDISNTGLKTISIPLKKIRRLNISGNSELTNIKHTEDNPKLFMNLEELDICGCKKLDIDNEFLKRLESLKYLGAIDVLLKGNDKCESLLQKSLRKITYGQYLDMKERGYNLDSSILKNSYSEIYSLRRLRVLCIGKDKISYLKLFSRGIKITDDQDSYRKSVEEDREEEKMSLARTWMRYVIRLNKHIS